MKRSTIILCALFVLSWMVVSYVLFCLLARIPWHLAKPSLIVGFVWQYRHIRAVRAALWLSGLVSTGFHGFLLGRQLSPKDPSPYGDARWAGEGDIRNAGLLGDQGILLAKHRGRYLCIPGWEHLMCFAPSGSGKGVGLVIPNFCIGGIRRSFMT